MATEEALPIAAEKTAEGSVPAAASDGKPQVTAGAEKKKSNQKKVKKVSKPRSGSTHPTYLEMIGEAITSLKERTGSSQYAIAKFIEEKHRAQLPPNFSKVLLVQLRKFSASGKLTKVKNSYKLPAITKKPAASPPAIAKKSATTKPKSTSSTSAKPKAKPAVKPKSKAVPAVKPKNKVAPATKSKAAVKVSKPKPKTVAKKPSGRPAKAAKTSAKDAPGKKAVVTKKQAVAAKATAPAKKPKTSKGAAKPPAKKPKTGKVAAAKPLAKKAAAVKTKK